MYRKFLSFALSCMLMLSNVVFAAPCKVNKIQHLDGPDDAKTDLVRVEVSQNVLLKENKLDIAFAENFNSKYYCPGDLVQFTFLNNVTTCEGVVIIPCGTTLLAKVDCIEKPKWLSRNAKVGLEFDKLVFSDGTTVPLCANLATKNGYLQKGAKETVGKVLAQTIAIGAVGTGLGAAIGVAGGNVISGVIIGGSIGGGIGLFTGLVSPGLYYKVKKGTLVHLELAESLAIPKQCP